MKQENPLLRAFFHPLVDAAQHKVPLAGENRPLKGDLVTDLPAEFLRKLPARNAASPVAEKGIFLLRWQNELGVEVEVALWLDGIIGEEILFGDVHTAEPVPVRKAFDPRHLPYPVFIGNGQGENERDRISCNQPGRG